MQMIPPDPTERVPVLGEADIRAAARTIVEAGRVDHLGDLVEEVRFADDGERFDVPALDFLADYWERHRTRPDGGRGPLARDVDALALRSILGSVLLLDALDDGLDARYRVYGTHVADRAGRDWTGFTVADMTQRVLPPLSLFFRASYKAVHNVGRPLFTRHRAPEWLLIARWERLVVPLFDETGACCRFLVAIVPCDQRDFTAEQQEAMQRRLYSAAPAPAGDGTER